MLQLQGIELALPNGNGGNNNGLSPVLRGIDLTLEEGKFYAITGPNGGGKTSLARLIMGIYRPTAGHIFWRGEEITGLSITERAQRGIGYAFQQPPRFKGLRVRDLLELAAREQPSDPNGSLLRRLCHSLRSVGLCPEDYLEREVDASLSGGEAKRLEVATLLLRKVQLVIYDEPESGVDLWSFDQLLRVILERHRRGGMTTAVITHHEQVLLQADEIILIAEGEVKARGPRAEMWPLITDRARCRWRRSCEEENDEAGCTR
ncbi:MAG: ATP-binding cassette domain-containing protein [Bacillota bacterium]|nr:ATP-binding cassette domain-containing protein [Bacillota bacterium]